MQLEIREILKKVRQIEIRTRRRTHAAMMGQYQSAFQGQGMSFAEVRQYEPGDEVRRIDWNKTARFQDTFVKVMEEERELSVFFLVDVSASMDYGTKTALKREFVAEICASLGFSAAANNDRVGLILYSDKVHKIIPPKKGRSHILTIIASILSADYRPAAANLDEALNLAVKLNRRRGFLFLFSDFGEDFDRKILKIAAKKNALLAIRIFDEKDEIIPDVGYALLRDAETGREFWANTSSPRWRYNFAEQQKQRVRMLGREFESASATFLNLATGSDYARELYRFFQKS